jgi:hypothetical protein
MWASQQHLQRVGAIVPRVHPDEDFILEFDLLIKECVLIGT